MAMVVRIHLTFGLRLKVLAIAFYLLGQSFLFSQRVTPFQSGSYLPVLSSLRDFAPAPNGMYIINYMYWVSPQSYYDQNGERISGIDIDLPADTPGVGDNLVDLYPEVRAFMGNFLLYYSSPLIEELGNARYSFLLGPSFQMVRYELDARVGSETFNERGGISGYGDFFLQPVGLGWSFNNRFDLSFSYGLYLPTASYQTGSDTNLGAGRLTHQFQLPFLAYFNEQSTAVLVASTFEINGELIDRDVRPGNRFSLEYGISQYITPWFEVELMNGHNWQVSDDRGEDTWWLNTPLQARDRQNLVSLGINVWSWSERLQMRFKYVWTYGAVQNVANNFFSASLFFDPHWLRKKQRLENQN